MIPCVQRENVWHTAKAYLEPSQTSKIELFVEMVNGFEPLTIFVKSSILDVCLGSQCVSVKI